ncbi:hypothetical protein BgiMline_018646 [Biomphalaria glabrata]|nr:hypothetical protein BgiMline_006258 [Biomphalaria glabrata]
MEIQPNDIINMEIQPNDIINMEIQSNDIITTILRFLSSHQLLVQYFQSSTLSLLAAVHFLPVRDIGPRFDPLADCPACSTMKTTWLGPDNSAVHFCLGNPGNRKPETAGSEERTKAIGYNLRELIRMHVHRVLALLTRQAGRDNPGFTEKKKNRLGKGEETRMKGKQPGVLKLDLNLKLRKQAGMKGRETNTF